MSSFGRRLAVAFKKVVLPDFGGLRIRMGIYHAMTALC